jgi:hypothetical protein
MVQIGASTTAGATVTISKALTVSPGNGSNDSISIGSSGTAGTGATVGGIAALTVGNGSGDTITVGAPSGSTVGLNGTGTSTITEGSGAGDSITVDTTTTVSQKLTINLGTSSGTVLYFNGTVGFGLVLGTNYLTVTSGTGANTNVTLGHLAHVNGTANLNLGASATNIVDYENYTGVGVGITTLFATASSGGAAFNKFDPDGRTTGIVFTGTWDTTYSDDPD